MKRVSEAWGWKDLVRNAKSGLFRRIAIRTVWPIRSGTTNGKKKKEKLKEDCQALQDQESWMRFKQEGRKTK